MTTLRPDLQSASRLFLIMGERDANTDDLQPKSAANLHWVSCRRNADRVLCERVSERLR